MNTYFITDWHTLTYLALERGANGDHLALVTENGYLFMLNIFTKKFIYSRKIHNGSIEALSWRGDTLVCCASDCTFSSIGFQYDTQADGSEVVRDQVAAVQGIAKI